MYCLQSVWGQGIPPLLPIYAVLVQPFGQTLGWPSPVWHGVKQGLPEHAGEAGFSCSARRNVSVIAASPPPVRIQNGKNNGRGELEEVCGPRDLLRLPTCVSVEQTWEGTRVDGAKKEVQSL